jgi:hypothetical protein
VEKCPTDHASQLLVFIQDNESKKFVLRSDWFANILTAHHLCYLLWLQRFDFFEAALRERDSLCMLSIQTCIHVDPPEYLMEAYL